MSNEAKPQDAMSGRPVGTLKGNSIGPAAGAVAPPDPEMIVRYHVEPSDDGDWHVLTYADGRQVKIVSTCPRVIVDPQRH